MSERAELLDSPGALIDVDEGAYPGGGVYVSWKAGTGLREMAMQAVIDHRFDDPALQRSGQISEIMVDAFTGLLRTCGYEVTLADPPDDLRPYTVPILATPDGERLPRFG